MLTLIALIALGSGIYGAYLKLSDLRNRPADLAILTACVCVALTAMHSLGCLWL